MSLLDDLKKEAEEAQAKREEEQSSTVAHKEQIREEMLPTMEALYTYFKEFADHLSVVNPEVTGDYLLEGLGTLSNLRQDGYKLATDEPDEVDKFTFHFTCSRDAKQEFRVAGAVAAEQHREILWNASLRFKKRETPDGAVFVVDAYVPVSMEFEADFERKVVRVRLRNLGTLGATSHMFSRDKVNNEFMDELAKCVLRRPNRFEELSGNTLSDTTRLRIREQVEEERRKRETELHVQLQAEERARKNNTLGKRLTRTLFGKKKRAGSPAQ